MSVDNQEISIEVAIIGTGVAGAFCAARLNELGYQVLVIEKARGSGGRLSSKRISLPDDSSVTVDLGASDFQITNENLVSALQEYVGSDLKSVSESPDSQRYVAAPRNSMLTRKMLSGVQALFSSRVVDMSSVGGEWLLSVEDKAQMNTSIRAKHIIITAPPEQASALLPLDHPLKDSLAKVPMLPQWVVVLVASDLNQLHHLEQASVDVDEFNYVSIESDKPERKNTSGHPFVVYLKPDWTQERLDWEKSDVLAHVKNRLESLGLDISDIEATHVHRWLYSLPTPKKEWSVGQNAFDSDSHWGEDRVGLCGDYMSSADLEGVQRACMSAQSLLDKFKRAAKPSGVAE